MAETPGPSEESRGSEGAGVPPPSASPVPGSGSQPVPGARPNAAPGMPGNPWMYSGGGAVPGYYTPPAPKPAAAGGAASGAAASTASKAGAEAKPADGGGKKADAKKGDGGGGDASLASVIDTIEAIIIALIVALTFRAFIVEAFVIPTGSMAPTLLGAHYKVICPKCGYEYDLETPLSEQTVMDTAGHHRVPNALFRELGSNRMVPMPSQEDVPAYCPNCRYPISAAELPQYIETAPTFYDNGKAPGKRPYVWANNGDRILVLKYLYSIMEPHHWDVIVFKEPQEAQDNYIKRLIGLPGETVQIIGGDVYINPKGKPDARDAVISRKPEELQQSLWQLVYDNSYYPVDEGVTPRYNAKEADGDVNRNVVYDSGPWINPWEPAAGSEKDWKKGPAMTYAGGGEGSLIFHPIPPGLPENVAKNYPPYGLNTLGYNNDFYVDDISGSGEFAPRSVVGDLRLETAWTPKGPGAASIKLILGRPNNCYRVTWSDKGLTLERYAPEPKNPDRWSFGPVTQINLTSGAHEAAEPNLAASIPAPVAGKTYQLAFDNVDRSVRFYIDGKKVLWFEENWNADLATDDVEKNPADWSNSPNLSVAVRLKQQERVNTMIEVDMGGPGTLSHLKVLRDLYYTQTTPQWALQYRPGTATQGHPLTLREDEFFAMGDNSRKSSDGRLWDRVYPPLGDLGLRPGIVPRRYLLGKAFFVYWPAGFTPAKDVPVLRDLPLVPNAGDMRVIR